MRITSNTWRDARTAIEEIKVEGTKYPFIFLCQEGAVRDSGKRTYSMGTGRWFITDDINAPDRCALNWRAR